MNDAPKRAAQRVVAEQAPRSIRVTKTLSLDHATYDAVKRRCADLGLPISTLMDQLLAAWLAEIGD